MNIKDLYEQRAGKWHTITITYITVGEATATKPDQNQFDQQKQLVYFMDDSGAEHEMAVYVPNTPDGLEIIPENLTGQRAVFDIKHKDGWLTGVLTTKVPDEATSTASKWDKINLGKCRHGILCAYIKHKGIDSLFADTGCRPFTDLNPFVASGINKLAKFSMTGEL